MTGNTEGGGQEMDRDIDREAEDRRRDLETLLSVEHLVTNDLSPAVFELNRPNTFKSTHLNTLISSIHAGTLTQADKDVAICCLVS